jgi:uncharacterized membrane protein YhaH (DUF805 family)
MSIFKALLSSQGEQKRSAFLLSILAATFISSLIFYTPELLDIVLPVDPLTEHTSLFIFTSQFVAIVFGLYVMYCLGIKRLRNMGHSAFIVILLLIPLVNISTTLVLALYPSKPISDGVLTDSEKKRNAWNHKTARNMYILFVILFFYKLTNLTDICTADPILADDLIISATGYAAGWLVIYLIGAYIVNIILGVMAGVIGYFFSFISLQFKKRYSLEKNKKKNHIIEGAMQTPSQKIIDLINEITILLDLVAEDNFTEFFAAKLREILKQLNGPHDISKVAREIQSIYGGMGTFGDVVIYQNKKVIKEHDVFDKKRTELYMACDEALSSTNHC